MNIENLFIQPQDLISATEVIFENYSTPIYKSETFDIKTSLSFVNFGCIKETDNVLIMSSDIDNITYGVSYIYTPKKLISYKLKQECDSVHNHSLDLSNWFNITELLDGYLYTNPEFMHINVDDANFTSDYFHVCIAAFISESNICKETLTGRFDLETGIEYDMFEKILIKASMSLKNDGVLLILCKPGWILKSWALVHDLGFQLEYESYSLYTNNLRHANSTLWVRFIKKGPHLNLNVHKRNILSLMKDNYIDRLFAHRNNLIFPYVELSYTNAESFIDLDQNLEYMQYFFSAETTKNLAQLCKGYTSCLVTPSIAKYASSINKNVVLFERDNRFRNNEGLKFVKYDLTTGLTKFTKNKYANAFDTVICDPPFDIKLDVLADDIAELLKTNKNSIAYVIFPSSRSISLINAMERKNLHLAQNDNNIIIEYSKPPKIVRLNGKQAIQLYKFIC